MVSLSNNIRRVPTPLGKSWIFLENFQVWKVLENDFGLGIYIVQDSVNPG